VVVNLHQRIQDLLTQLPNEQRRVLRHVQSTRPGELELAGHWIADFASNDYLGLAGHPPLIKRACQWANQHGAGVRASRLVSGNLECVERLEQKLAELKGSEAALIMAAGFQTNSTVLAALLDRRLNADGHFVQLFADRLCHSSFHFGVAASGVRQHRFRHNDLEHLSSLLCKNADTHGMKLIATESLFSMDGDRLDVSTMRHLARQHDAMLYVDDAHATGLFGQRGMGLMSDAMHPDDVVIGTFGKALGSFGSYVACSATVRDYLVNRCSGLIYSTGLPPMICGAIDWALDSVPGMKAERQHLQELSQQLRCGLQDLGLDTLDSDTQIIPVLIGDDRRVLQLAQRLLEDGFLVGAIRPPTVPPGSARLRISLSAAHSQVQVARLTESIGRHIQIDTSLIPPNSSERTVGEADR